MDNHFGFWQSLDRDAWVATLRRRFDSLSDDEHRASVAYLFSEKDWIDQWETAAGPLARVPVVIKDLFAVRGTVTTGSSRFWAERTGLAMEDAELTRRIREAGGVIVAKTHLNEFAYGLSGENPHFGNCPHPFLPGRLSGGSSSGSAFLVGRGVVPLGVGTDTGGSIRVPAAYCGLHAYRSIPGEAMEGCLPLAPTFDTGGFFTTTSPDRQVAQEALDPERRWPGREGGLGLVPPWLESDFDWRHALAANGFPVDEALSAQLFEESAKRVRAFTILQSSEAFGFHRPWLEEEKERYDPAVYARIRRGGDWTDQECDEAREVLSEVSFFFRDALREFSGVALPAAPTPAPRPERCDDRFRSVTLALTVPASLAGLPAVCLPLEEEGEPRGIQVLFLR